MIGEIKKYKRFIYITLLVIIILPVFLDYFIFGNSMNSNLNNSEWADFFGSYIGSIIGGVATLVAVIISFRISKNDQTEEIIKENSLIVYYDLVLGLSDLKKLYINIKYPTFKDIPTIMFVSNEWIKNVAKTSCDVKTIEVVYKLYGYLEIIREEVKKMNEMQTYNNVEEYYDKNRYTNIINKISQTLFSRTFLNYDMETYVNYHNAELDIDNDLNDDVKNVVFTLSKKMST